MTVFINYDSVFLRDLVEIVLDLISIEFGKFGIFNRHNSNFNVVGLEFLPNNSLQSCYCQLDSLLLR